MRQITIDGTVYRYKVGKTYTRFDNGDVVSNSQLIGVLSWVYEKGQHKGTSDGMVTPSAIERYIRGKQT